MAAPASSWSLGTNTRLALLRDPGIAAEPASSAPADYGPQVAPDAPPPRDEDARGRVSMGGQIHSVLWEVGAYALYETAVNIHKVDDVGSRPFHLQDEGFFGKHTYNLGVDKLAHAYDTYLIAEVLRARIDRKTGRSPGSAYTAALLASGLMLYGEFYDGIKQSSGFSFQDMLFNTGGAAFSIVRHIVPGLKDKLDYRAEIIPNGDVFTPAGAKHYRQQRYLLALKLSGFDAFANSPLRFLELHAGYYATGFTPKEKADGDPLRRKPFVGIGLNLGALLFPHSGTRVGRAIASGLNYVQVPYTDYKFHR